jgi:formylglycine-generating enzyme required for sulfatase activity
LYFDVKTKSLDIEYKDGEPDKKSKNRIKMEKKMPWLITKILPYLFCVLTLTFGICACGTDNTHDSESRQSTTGTYQAALIFPGDIFREASTAQAVTGIDCEAVQISTIEFTFSNSSHGPYVYACEDHEAHIKEIPAGTDIRVDVYAYDENHASVLYGFEITDIHAGQVTEGGEIEMKPVDENQPDNDNDNQTDADGDGFSADEDCDDTDAYINPDAEEIPDNNIDENCDGQTEVSAFTIADFNMEFVRIPDGEFNMGSPLLEAGRRDDENLHRVRLTHSFYLQTTEVTQVQWRAVVNAATGTTLNLNPSYFTHCGDDCPVENVSWEDVQIFIDVLNTMYENAYEFHLPTEAQWEYAARAGSDTAFANGNISTASGCNYDRNLDVMGWYCYNADDSTHEVAQKPPNGFGLYDMHGNVWEWCQDYYGVYPEGPSTDYEGPSSGSERTFRGGSWINGPNGCRSARRVGHEPNNYRRHYVGFRLVCSHYSR